VIQPGVARGPAPSSPTRRSDGGTRWLCALLLLPACGEPPPPADDDDATTEPPPGEWTLHDEVVCADPAPSLALTEEAFVRGVVPDTSNRVGPGGAEWVVLTVAAADLDGDDDVDLLFGSAGAEPQIFENDGAGHFDAVAAAPFPNGPFPAAFAVADLTGDRLLDLLVFDQQDLLVAPNLGGMQFGDYATVWDQPPAPSPHVSTLALGDVDGDGDLDVWLAGLEVFDGPNQTAAASPDRLLLNDGGTFSLGAEFLPSGGPGLSIVAAFTDRDGDGDADVLALSDRPQGLAPTAFWRNDGVVDGQPVLVDDAADVGADLPLSGMGVAKADLNGDGDLDYCVTDTGPLVCLLSLDGGYVEGAASLGLTQPDGIAGLWSGWSLEFVDLDADGHLDVPVAASAPGQNFAEDPKFASQPNALFVGGLGGFVERGAELGFDRGDPTFGLVAADLTGDGFPDLVTASPGAPATVSIAQCTAGAWLQVELVGPPGNSWGWGARVEIDDQVREVSGPRGHGQGPGWVHAGLGDADEATVRVVWPDGEATEATVGTRRRVTVRHPSLL